MASCGSRIFLSSPHSCPAFASSDSPTLLSSFFCDLESHEGDDDDDSAQMVSTVDVDDDAAVAQLPAGSTKEDVGKLQFGCEHYRRRCKLRAPCCNQVFWCRHCHNAVTSASSNPKDYHEFPRHDVSHVICAICNMEQKVSQVCEGCGVKMGEYFCDVCKFYDDEITRGQFHCDECGICRVGGRDNFFHCLKCASCYSVVLRENHLCVENSMKNQCPICYEYLFDSITTAQILKCGHTMHMDCFTEMLEQNQYRCPICSKSVIDMSRTWERLDMEIAATAMHEEHQYEVPVLCNDCNKTSRPLFHILGHKCGHCGSYNTRVTGGTQQNTLHTS